jgi:U3 small nucleolar RNA-associated protein 25
MDSSSITTRLLTLLNVSATKIGKRKGIEEDFIPSEKLNKRKSREPTSASEEKENNAAKEESTAPAADGEDVEESGDAGPQGSFQLQRFLRVDYSFFADATDPYEQHFGMKPHVLSEKSRASVQNNSLKTSREKFGQLGSVIVSIPDASEANTSAATASTSVNLIN